MLRNVAKCRQTSQNVAERPSKTYKGTLKTKDRSTELVLDSWEVVRDGAAALLMALPRPLPGLTSNSDVHPIVRNAHCTAHAVSVYHYARLHPLQLVCHT